MGTSVDGLRSRLADHLLADRSRRARREGKGVIAFRCPAHDDRDPSAWLGDHAWGCHGCSAAGDLRDLAGRLGLDPGPASSGYTLEDYADEKAFPVAKLREWGLATEEIRGQNVLCIPYLGPAPDRPLLRKRYRAHDRRWWSGRNRDIWPYGLSVISQVDPGRAVLVVEGESDCHAAWLGNVPALGIPGANAWRSSWKRYLSGLRPIIWREPDQGGATFARSLARDFPEARVIDAEDVGVKDVAALRLACNGDFPERLRSFMRDARPIGTRKPPVIFDPLLPPRLERMREERAGPVDATPTGFKSWDRASHGAGAGRGLGRAWHVVIGGRTGHGKSLLALNLAAAAVRAGERVCFLSLEMSQPEMVTRFLSIVAGQPIRELEPGPNFREETWQTASDALQQIDEQMGGSLFLNREPLSDLGAVEDSIRYYHEVCGCRFFIVDYLQLARVSGSRSLFDQVQEVSRRVRGLAKKLEATTVGLSQLNRDSLAGGAPTVEGLYGGSALGNDADQVILLDHSRVSRLETGDRASYLLVAKNRHGPIVEVPTCLEVTTLRIREALPDEMDAWL